MVADTPPGDGRWAAGTPGARRRAAPLFARAVVKLGLCLALAAVPTGGVATTQPGLTAAAAVARAYDLVLDADFDAVPAALRETCPPAPPVACLGLNALATWWSIQLDPDNHALDGRFATEVSATLGEAEAWAAREPGRAEAWFYLGAALGVRGQWRVLRGERLSAARDGRRIKDALDRALAVDPSMADAAFGVGVYRYYAAVAPAVFRWLRWILLLPGGNRAEGLSLMERARRDGLIVRDEAAFQLHLAYLWYERRFDEALALVRDLKARHSRNPLFAHLEAEILDVYFHDAASSLAASEALLAAARERRVFRADLAAVRARLNIAVQLDALGERDRARATLGALLADAPAAPIDAIRRARQLRRAWAGR